jgi:hypothetical protein
MYIEGKQILHWHGLIIESKTADRIIKQPWTRFFFCKIASCVKIAKPAGARTVNVTILILITKFSIFLST